MRLICWFADEYIRKNFSTLVLFSIFTRKYASVTEKKILLRAKTDFFRYWLRSYLEYFLANDSSAWKHLDDLEWKNKQKTFSWTILIQRKWARFFFAYRIPCAFSIVQSHYRNVYSNGCNAGLVWFISFDYFITSKFITSRIGYVKQHTTADYSHWYASYSIWNRKNDFKFSLQDVKLAANAYSHFCGVRSV